MTEDEMFQVMLSGAYGTVSLPDLLTALANRIQRIEKGEENHSRAEMQFAYAQGVVVGAVRAEADIVKRFTLTPKTLQRGPDPDDLPEGW